MFFRHRCSILLSELSEYLLGTVEDASRDLDLDDNQMNYDE